MIYIFDVDGTLTPSRSVIDPSFKKWFLRFVKTHPVFLVTGSDKQKTVEQVGEEIYNACVKVYNCSGNDVWKGSTHLYSNKWHLPADAHKWLEEQLNASQFKLRTGLHFEHRPGMCNFSVVGRNATVEERQQYVKYDSESYERSKIAKRFNKTFPKLSAKVGGETGIDIFPKGLDKGQILRDFDSIEMQYIDFFGDRCDYAGNDYPVAMQLKENQVYSVKDWQHTWRELKKRV